MLVALHEVHVAERLRGLGIAGVRHLLPVLRAVTGVVEARVGREDPRIERGGGGDRLERRARRVEPLRRAVVERRRRPRTGGRRVQDAGIALVRLDLVRVEAGRRGHRVDLAGLRVEHDRGAALAFEQVLGESLDVRADVQDDVVARDRRAFQRVAELVEDRAEVRVRGGQVGVLRALDAGARPALGRVADRLRGQTVPGVLPEVERLPGDLPPDVLRQHEPVRGEDQPPLDAELRDPLDLVVLACGQARRRPRLPVRRRDDQRGEQQERDQRQPGDLPVHRRAFARLETRRRPASSRKFATTDEPP